MILAKHCLFATFLLLLMFPKYGLATENKKITISARETLSAVELNVGDSLVFILKNGEQRTLVLGEVKTEIIFTSLQETKKGKKGNGTIYSMKCQVNLDGQNMEMIRYVPVQQSFYEPYVINGVRIWFDGLKSLENHFNENHGPCLPKKDARFALQDVTLPICPQELTNWYPNPGNFISIAESYNGDDAWLGPYFGADLHGGLDINMPINTPLWAPFDIDEHYYFNSLKAGDKNNRWRGIKKWPNGDTWIIQSHHLVELLIPEYTPIRQGKTYALTAGVYYGAHPHTHFNFKIDHGGGEIFLDPWILFWQIFENNKTKTGTIKANMLPVAPSETGKPVRFKSSGSRAGITGNQLTYYWTFGDGGFSMDPNPLHTFQQPGIYPVSLLVDDGTNKARFTQHITINGTTMKKPALILISEDPSFRTRRPHEMDTYGILLTSTPHTLDFIAYPKGRANTGGKKVFIGNTGSGDLAKKVKTEVLYQHASGWLSLESQGQGNEQSLSISVDATALTRGQGFYSALVKVSHDGALNSPQFFKVVLNNPGKPAENHIVLDNRDAACHPSPYDWLAPQFHYAWAKGYEGDFFISADNGYGGSVRFTPYLQKGRYRILLDGPAYHHEVWRDKLNGFFVRVKHQDGEKKVWIKPQRSLEVGTFNFAGGSDGFVEILSENANGLVIADAVQFVPADGTAEDSR